MTNEQEAIRLTGLIPYSEWLDMIKLPCDRLGDPVVEPVDSTIGPDRYRTKDDPYQWAQIFGGVEITALALNSAGKAIAGSADGKIYIEN